MIEISQMLRQLVDDLVSIPPGAVWLGSSVSDIDDELRTSPMPGVQREWLLKEVPAHQLQLPAFRISRHPLTIGQVEALAPWTGLGPGLDGGQLEPATLGVPGSFQLCAALSDLLQTSVTLPSEAQWVRAARGDSTQKYPWGDDWRDNAANLAEAGLGRTCPVGQYPAGASRFGLLDMIGNADELTRSLYRPYDGAPAEVPRLEKWARSPFVTKGGGWLHGRDLARCVRRHGIYGDDEPLAIRLVLPG